MLGLHIAELVRERRGDGHLDFEGHGDLNLRSAGERVVQFHPRNVVWEHGFGRLLVDGQSRVVF